MYFLIDFENTGSSGLKGVEYLTEEDRICIFFSQCCGKIEKGLLRRIMESRCEIDGVKLARNGKNALDFYIASRLGKCLAQGMKGELRLSVKIRGLRLCRITGSSQTDADRILF